MAQSLDDLLPRGLTEFLDMMIEQSVRKRKRELFNASSPRVKAMLLVLSPDEFEEEDEGFQSRAAPKALPIGMV